MPRITLTLGPDLLDELVRLKPKSLSLSSFCSLLVEQQTLALDSASKLPAYRVGAGTQSVQETAVQTASAAQDDLESAGAIQQASLAVDGLAVDGQIDPPLEPQKKGGVGEKKIDPYGRRALDLDLIPADLLDCQQLLPEFWAVKKGTRSQTVFTRVCNKLRQWDPDQRREALERAIASGWGDVFEPPSVKASNGTTGAYVDSITRDRIEREKFLAMFSTQEAA